MTMMTMMVFREGDVHSAVIKELYEYELHEQYLRQVIDMHDDDSSDDDVGNDNSAKMIL